jgi:hypothetical protein
MHRPRWASACHVFATGSDTSQYGAYANASADAPHSEALAVGATSSAGKTVKVSVFLSCQADTRVPSGKLVVLSTAVFQKCSISGSADTDYSGRVTVQLLRR